MTSDPHICIAVVDDDERFSRAFARQLRALGMQPIVYASAEAFLADTKHPEFDCLLIDVQLGGMSGIELHRELVVRQLRTPVIFITGGDEPEAYEHARSARAAFLRKTEPGAVVIDAIRRAADVTLRGRQ